jgi:hypothetical protein
MRIENRRSAVSYTSLRARTDARNNNAHRENPCEKVGHSGVCGKLHELFDGGRWRDGRGGNGGREDGCGGCCAGSEQAEGEGIDFIKEILGKL